jgi:hypothetical protein
MKSKIGQEELDRQRVIILQTLEYMIECYTGFFVFDDYDPSKEYYLQEKNRIEIYYKQRRLDRLKAKLTGFMQVLYSKKDVKYQHYIEEKTGHHIDLYDDLRVRAARIVQNGIISSMEESTDIEFMILICSRGFSSSFDINLMQNMLDKYQEVNIGQIRESNLYTHEEIFVSKLKLEQGLIYRVNSPNNKNWIALYTSGKNEFALTYLVAGVDGGNGSVFCAKGKDLNIKAEWENDYTIVIETFQKHEILNCYKKITTKNSNINIKYIGDNI